MTAELETALKNVILKVLYGNCMTIDHIADDITSIERYASAIVLKDKNWTWYDVKLKVEECINNNTDLFITNGSLYQLSTKGHDSFYSLEQQQQTNEKTADLILNKLDQMGNILESNKLKYKIDDSIDGNLCFYELIINKHVYKIDKEGNIKEKFV